MEFFRPDTGVGSCSLFQGISQPRDQTQVSCIAGRFLPAVPPGKPKNTGVDSLFLLQHIFPTQEPNQGLLHCRQILYQKSYQGSTHVIIDLYKPLQCTGVNCNINYGLWIVIVYQCRFINIKCNKCTSAVGDAYKESFACLGA